MCSDDDAARSSPGSRAHPGDAQVRRLRSSGMGRDGGRAVRTGRVCGSSTTASSSRTGRRSTWCRSAWSGRTGGSSTRCPPSSTRAGPGRGCAPTCCRSCRRRRTRRGGRAQRLRADLLEFLTRAGRGRAVGLDRGLRPRGAVPAVGRDAGAAAGPAAVHPRAAPALGGRRAPAAAAAHVRRARRAGRRPAEPRRWEAIEAAVAAR